MKELAEKLLAFKVGHMPNSCKGDGFLPEDENAPFFTEAYLYNLIGKEKARELLGLMDKIWEEAGISEFNRP